MKKILSALIVVVSVLSCVLLCAAAPTHKYTYKVVLPETSLYSEADIQSNVLQKLPKDAIVELIDEPFLIGDIEWQKISYTNLTGFVASSSLYRSIKNDHFEVTRAKAKTTEMGVDIELFGTHSTDLPADKMIHDGESLRVINDGIDYGEFRLIEYDGAYYFIKAENITNGLSYNQKLAVIIASCSLGVFISSALIVVLVRKKSQN